MGTLMRGARRSEPGPRPVPCWRVCSAGWFPKSEVSVGGFFPLLNPISSPPHLGRAAQGVQRFVGCELLSQVLLLGEVGGRVGKGKAHPYLC